MGITKRNSVSIRRKKIQLSPKSDSNLRLFCGYLKTNKGLVQEEQMKKESPGGLGNDVSEDRWTPQPTCGMWPRWWGLTDLREPTACCIEYPSQVSVFVKIRPVHLVVSSFEQLNLLSFFG